MEMLVVGRSQVGRILSDVVPQACGGLRGPMIAKLRISHQARDEDGTRVRTFYAQHGIQADVQRFFQDAPRLMSEAQLVISRAGASSVADLSVIGRPAILVPFAAATGDHQTANARGLVEAGAAVLIPEARLSAATLTEQIQSILSQSAGAIQMSLAALSVGKRDAATDLADLVDTLAAQEAA